LNNKNILKIMSDIVTVDHQIAELNIKRGSLGMKLMKELLSDN